MTILRLVELWCIHSMEYYTTKKKRKKKRMWYRYLGIDMELFPRLLSEKKKHPLVKE